MDAPSDPENPVSLKGDFDWKALSQKTWVIVLAGLLMPPLGMILTWLKPGWATRTKWIATGLMCIVIWSWIDGRRDRNIKPQAGSDDSAEVTENTDERDSSDYQEGYRYARGVLAAAERAPPDRKRQAMRPLIDLAEEAERGSRSKPRLFYKGMSQAMLEAVNNAAR